MRSRKEDCPFKAVICKRDDCFILQLFHPQHDGHAPFLTSISIPQIRKSTWPEGVVEKVIAMSIDEACKPRQIIKAVIREFPGVMLIEKDIYNIKLRHRTSKLGMFTPTQLLPFELQERGYKHKVQ